VPQIAIFGPFFATIGLTFVVWVWMDVKRIRFLTSNQVDPKDMAVPVRSPHSRRPTSRIRPTT